jgi:beta-glucosidase
MSGFRFPADFLWGASTSAYQIEGAAEERGRTIWDLFCDTPGKVFAGHTGRTACDHVRRWREDVALMRALGLRSYRFSVSWARVLPEGAGRIRPAGLDFYDRLVDELTGAGIVPLATLYHWDLPQALQDLGGWEQRDTARRFADYAALLFQRLADRVRHWITLNEPYVAAHLGYRTGEHAPGFRDEGRAVQVAHHLLLAHAWAVQAFRQEAREGKIGISLDLPWVQPATDDPDDRAAANRYEDYHNRWFLDPVFRGRYPVELEEAFHRRHGTPRPQAGDLEALAAAPVDFLGVNYYFRQLVRRPADGQAEPQALFEIVQPVYRGARFTAMGWEVWPEGLYDQLRRLDRDYGRPELIVTENGAAFPDRRRADGRVDDRKRVDYLRAHLAAAARALEAGVRLRGYQVWSLLDNFEWAFGFQRRFGLVHVDFATQERRLKSSARWYRELIARGGI